MSSPSAAYLGPVASFTNQAAFEYFGTGANLIPKVSFADVFEAVQSSQVEFGVVPIENSSNGSVVQLLDLLADREGKYSNVKVVSEHYLTVHHCLLVGKSRKRMAGVVDGEVNDAELGGRAGAGDKVRLEDIRKLYTHPQAWGQCNDFLAKHLKGVERHDVSSTSKGAEIVAQDGTGTSGAIASKLAAEVNHLDILAENIEDQGDNTTRFFIVKKVTDSTFEASHFGPSSSNGMHDQQRLRLPAGEEDGHRKKWKSLLSFTIDHEEPGTLADALAIFKRHNFNLTSIDTRPSRLRPWHYIFFVECESYKSSKSEKDVRAVMADLRPVAESCKHLGYWQDQLNRGASP